MQKAPPLSVQAQKEKDRLKNQRESQLKSREQQINKQSDEEIVQQLKAKGLAVYGTKQEKLDRLKKLLGIPEPYIAPDQPEVKKSAPTPPKSNVLDNIEKMKQKRDERRFLMEEKKNEKAEREAENQALGKVGDVEFELMIEKNKLQDGLIQEHQPATIVKLCVCIRKRPIFKKEANNGEIDAISCSNPQIRVHEPKLKVDGITKYVQNHTFTFDNTFNEKEDTIDIYAYSLKPLLDRLFNNGVVTCFAYGQTGSGKTFTMKGIQEQTVTDLFALLPSGMKVMVSFFEIYGGKCYDLLNNKSQLAILEDKNNNIQIQGLVEKLASTPVELFQLMEYGHSIRTTHATVANDTSSRSHAICQLIIRDDKEKETGKLILVDLAGSERAQDTQSNNRQRRMEGAEINKSLLALKECIRAMDDNANHVPFRASKLTLVLRDSFTAKANRSRIVMIACVSPGSSSADHSLNTLRYADRLKEKSNPQKLSEQEPEQRQEAPKPQQKLNSEDEEQKNQARGQWGGKVAQVQNNGQNQNVQNGQNGHNVQSGQNGQNGQNGHNGQNGSHGSNGQNAQNNQNSQQGQQGGVQKPNSQVSGQRKGEERSPNHQQQVQNKVQQKQQVQQQKIVEQKPDSPIDYDDDVPLIQPNNNVKEDVRCMKETMKPELNQEEVVNKEEFFDFHDKVNAILEEQDEILAIHMAAIKEDAKLLTQESELIQSIQGVGIVDYDVDSYVNNLELFIKKKLKIYNLLNRKLQQFKVHLKEEEEISSKMKNTFYY